MTPRSAGASRLLGLHASRGTCPWTARDRSPPSGELAEDLTAHRVRDALQEGICHSPPSSFCKTDKRDDKSPCWIRAGPRHGICPAVRYHGDFLAVLLAHDRDTPFVRAAAAPRERFSTLCNFRPGPASGKLCRTIPNNSPRVRCVKYMTQGREWHGHCIELFSSTKSE
jgi:hypothetical protein